MTIYTSETIITSSTRDNVKQQQTTINQQKRMLVIGDSFKKNDGDTEIRKTGKRVIPPEVLKKINKKP